MEEENSTISYLSKPLAALAARLFTVCAGAEGAEMDQVVGEINYQLSHMLASLQALYGLPDTYLQLIAQDVEARFGGELAEAMDFVGMSVEENEETT